MPLFSRKEAGSLAECLRVGSVDGAGVGVGKGVGDEVYEGVRRISREVGVWYER